MKEILADPPFDADQAHPSVDANRSMLETEGRWTTAKPQREKAGLRIQAEAVEAVEVEPEEG